MKSRSQRKVTFILPDYYRHPIGGYIVVYNYANYLAARGWLVTILYSIPSYSSGSRLRHLRRTLWLALVRRSRSPKISWFRFSPGVRLKFMTSPLANSVPEADAIVATAWQTAGLVAAMPAEKGAKFYLVQHHEIWSGPEREVNATFSLPLNGVAISKWLLPIVKGLGMASAYHIPNGLDHSQFRDLSLHRSQHILSLYHHEAFKGVEDAFECFRIVRETIPDLRITMFGTMRRGRDIPEWIDYVREPTGDRLVNLYNSAQVYVSASLAEGWALPPAEAMSCGCLFVGTDSGGCRDFAENGKTALLSPPRRPDLLAANLIRALSGGRDIDLIRERGTDYIGQFTWERSGSALETLFNTTICGAAT